MTCIMTQFLFPPILRMAPDVKECQCMATSNGRPACIETPPDPDGYTLSRAHLHDCLAPDCTAALGLIALELKSQLDRHIKSSFKLK